MKLDKLKSSNMNENGSVETHVVLMTGLLPGYSEHNLTALFMLFKASDESSGRCSPTHDGEGGGVGDKANISAFMGLDNQSAVLENGPRN